MIYFVYLLELIQVPLGVLLSQFDNHCCGRPVFFVLQPANCAVEGLCSPWVLHGFSGTDTIEHLWSPSVWQQMFCMRPAFFISSTALLLVEDLSSLSVLPHKFCTALHCKRPVLSLWSTKQHAYSRPTIKSPMFSIWSWAHVQYYRKNCVLHMILSTHTVL